MRQAERGDNVHPEFSRGHDAVVPRDDSEIFADQNRIIDGKFCDTVGNLPDLISSMRPCVAGVGTQRRDRHHFDI